MSILAPLPQDDSISTQLRNWMLAMQTDDIAHDSLLTSHSIQLATLRQPNLFIDGEMQVAQGAPVAVSNAPQYGTVDMWAGWVSGGVPSAGTLGAGGGGGLPSQTSILVNPLTCTAPGTVSFRQRLEKSVARSIALVFSQAQSVFGSTFLGVPLSASFQIRGSNVGVAGSAVIVIRAPTVADNFGATTVLATSAPVAFVQDNAFHPVYFDNIGIVTADQMQFGLEVELQLTIGAVVAKNIIITQAQLCVGSTIPRVYITTPFDLQYARVQRYFQKSFPYATAPATNTNVFDGVLQYQATRAGVNTTSTLLPLKAPMRTSSPTWTFYNPGAANALWRNRLGTDSGAASVGTPGETYNYILNPQVAGDAIGNNIAIHWTADARF